MTMGDILTIGKSREDDPNNGVAALTTMSTSTAHQYYYHDEPMWKDFCIWLSRQGVVGQFMVNTVFRRITVNAKVILCYVLLCTILHMLQITLLPGMARSLGVRDVMIWTPWGLLSWVTHILVHSDFMHLKGNMTYLLLVGPSVEHEYGSRNLFVIMLVVAIASAVAHIVLGKSRTHQIGASGVVFSCILLNSLSSGAGNGQIPLSFVLTACLWLGDELWRLLFSRDSVSHHAHLVGGFIGAAAGFFIQGRQSQRRMHITVQRWWKQTVSTSNSARNTAKSTSTKTATSSSLSSWTASLSRKKSKSKAK